MKLDFSQTRLNPKAFSEASMQFGHPQATTELAAIMEIIAVETGPRRARENWQQAQLRNLLLHAAGRSTFWRNRIRAKNAGDAKLKDLPVLTRLELVGQVTSEGALLRAGDRIPVKTHATSGSSGVPVAFFHSEMNGVYNERRSHAQFFIEDRALDSNWTRCRALGFAELAAGGDPPSGFKVERGAGWLGPLSLMFRSGEKKTIHYSRPDPRAFVKELMRDPVGYLVAQPRVLESIFADVDAGALVKAGTRMLLPVSGRLDPALRKRIEDQGVPVRGSYSCEEIGPIAMECPACPDHYHVAGSNVIVEVDRSEMAHERQRLGRILVTHLHSYATPFIRYDLGDLGALTDTCPCGYDGQTLSHILGRTKNILKHRDGSLTPFLPRATDLLKVGAYPEYRIRQTEVDRIVVEVGGCAELPEDQRLGYERLMKTLAGEDFAVEIRPVPRIDWGASVKRLLFNNEII